MATMVSSSVGDFVSRAPWWRRVGINILLGDIGRREADVDVSKAFALSKWVLPSTLVASDLSSARVVSDENMTPVLCFVNRDSGGRRGKALLDSLRRGLTLNPLQVCDLKDTSPGDRLKLFRSIAHKVNIICCGGDGTINWVMDELSRLNMTVGSFGIIPLGTGNDLYLQTFQLTLQAQQKEISAAVEKSGMSTTFFTPSTYSYAVSPEQIVQNPQAVLANHAWNMQQGNGQNNQVELNRWLATITATNTEQFVQIQQAASQDSEQKWQSWAARAGGLGARWLLALLAQLLSRLSLKRALKVATLGLGAKKRRTQVFSNYVGFGVDGAVSLSFSHMRSAAPFLFFSSVLNKAWYGLCGLYQVVLGRHRRDLSRAVHITCDGRPVPMPPGIRGLVALNINSYAGGTKLWHANEPFQRGFGARLGSWGSSSMSDGMLEVMGVYGIRHLGLIKSGLASAVPICQGRRLAFNCTIQTPMQIDGEPFMQKPCVVELTLEETVRVTVPLVTSSCTEHCEVEYERE